MENFQLQAWTNPPWFGSSQSQNLQLVPSDLTDLSTCLIGLLSDSFPDWPNLQANKACVLAGLAVFRDFCGEIGIFPQPVNLGWAIANLAFQCGLASACDLCTATGGVITPSCVVCVAGTLAANLQKIYNGYNDLKDCVTTSSQVGKVSASVKAIGSFDPNNKAGPLGVGQAQWVSGRQPLTYDVLFENLPSATAPAQQVVITDQLDTTKVDLSTLSLGPISFGNNQVVPPPTSRTFAADVDLRPTQDLIVSITGSLDPNKGLLTWHFISIDPATGNPPIGVGFLRKWTPALVPAVRKGRQTSRGAGTPQGPGLRGRVFGKSGF